MPRFRRVALQRPHAVGLRCGLLRSCRSAASAVPGRSDRLPPLSRNHSLLSTILLLFLLAGCQSSGEKPSSCTDPLGCVQINPGEPVRIGVLQALSGDIAPLGQAQVRGLELALDKYRNTLGGHPVALQIEDTGCTAEGGANAVLKIIADPQTVAIFGTTCSGAAATASQAMSAAGLTMISGNNSAPFLTSIGGKAAPDHHPGYFRTANNEELAGRVAAEYAYNILGLREAAAIHDSDIYTMGLTGIFKTAFEEMGGRVVFYGAVNKGDVEMRPILQAVIQSGAQLLFFPLFQPEAKQLLLQARTLPELEKTILMSDGALIQQSFLDSVGPAAKGMYFIGPSRPLGPAADALDAAYEAKYGQPPTVSYYITGYDAADLLFSAIGQTMETGPNGELSLGRQKLRDSLSATSGFDGVSGTLSCSRFGDCGQQAFNILRLDQPEQGLIGLESNVIYSNRQPK